MEGSQGFCAVLLVWSFVLADLILADNEYMVSKAEQITLEFRYETKLTCEMNIEPDKFLWKFYPTDDYYNPKADIDLSSNYELKSEMKSEKHNRQRKKSSLPIVANKFTIAGDYQCLAYYGASVVASVPWRITIAKLNKFKDQESANVVVTEGNTVSWRCDPPESNPEAYIDYYKDNKRIEPPFLKPKIKTLLLQNVSYEDNGQYKCTATVNTKQNESNTTLTLNVAKYLPLKEPTFIIRPKDTYTTIKGGTVFLDCAAIGNPVPRVVWFKKNGELPKDRIEMMSGGLKIKNISSTDDGVYVCNYTNVRGAISHHITVIYNEEPSVECDVNMTDVKQGENLDLDCTVRGTPEPKITWFLNGFSIKNDTSIEAIGNRIYFRPIEKRHAGNLQIFARNPVKTVYASISLRVVPLSSSDTSMPQRNHHRHTNKAKGTRKPQKHGKNKGSEMVPPTKPVISRVNDETVMIRWSVPDNNGLPIQFFKVQYRELGQANSKEFHRGKGWQTLNADIPPNIKNYEVTNLKSEYLYKFRIAAVFSNNDNKPSVNSDKFHLRRLDFDDRNPLPVPILTKADTIDPTSVRIHWKLPSHPSPNATIEGYYISYLSSSKAGDYLTATVDGRNTNSYVVSHLQPDMFYDIKIQSFNSRSASQFSEILKGKTAAVAVSVTPANQPASSTPSNPTKSSQLYIFIAIGVILMALLASAVVMLFVCRKWKQKKNLDENNKGAVEEHHIQADGNEYVVGPKTLPRSNGCALPTNRITITANPLADADNKNQNMIEMSCMTAQNNNFTQPSSATSDDQPASSKTTNKIKNREKSKRNKNVDNKSSGENYV